MVSCLTYPDLLRCYAVSLLVARQRSDLRTATGFLNVAAVTFLAILGVRFAMGAGDLLDRASLQDLWQEQSALQSTGPAPAILNLGESSILQELEGTILAR